MTAAAYDLCTIAEVNTYLGGAVVTADQAKIQALLTAASVFIQTYLGYSPIQQTYVETFNGIGNTSRMLNVRPIVSVQSVAIDGVTIPPRANAAASGWTNDKNLVYLSGYEFNRNAQNCTVNYTAGYAQIPEDIKQIVIDITVNKYKRSGRVGVSSTGMGRETVTFNSSDLSSENKVTLDQYQLVSMG